MKKIGVFSTLLILGLIGSQFLPAWLGEYLTFGREVISVLTMVGLSFIMIHVGYEFELNKTRIRSYGWDYIVAMTTAGFPWVFAALYFVFVMLPPDFWNSWQAWKEVLLAGRFAAPTATGVLFSMLAAAGLSATWMFRKTRILVIFDDLDTVLLMIPLKIMMIGLAWQLGIIVVMMLLMLWIAWHYLHRLSIPTSWPWVLTYSFVIVGISEAVYWGTKVIDYRVPIHIEVLLPAFVLGCVMKLPTESDPHKDDSRNGHQEGLESRIEQLVATIVSSVFMVLVGLSMPTIYGETSTSNIETITAQQPTLSPLALAGHVVILTLIINIGKLFPTFCYRREVHWRERLAVAIGMMPRGEVGAGIILLSLEYGISGPIVSVAVLSLALNLLLTPAFVYAVNYLIRTAPKNIHNPPKNYPESYQEMPS